MMVLHSECIRMVIAIASACPSVGGMHEAPWISWTRILLRTAVLILTNTSCLPPIGSPVPRCFSWANIVLQV
jgi:hypothetical protein